MGSLLGPALAHIFVGYYEDKLFSQTQKPKHTSQLLTTYVNFTARIIKYPPIYYKICFSCVVTS